MDLSTITVSDFKLLFTRDFPYLPVYDPAKLYNSGRRVYYPTTELFYDCITDGTQGIAPTVAANWLRVDDDVENYVLDSDIERAFEEAKIVMNQTFFSTDPQIKMAYLYLTAAYLVNDIQAAMGGIMGGAAFSLTSRKVGNVSETYGIPKAYLEDPIYAFYIQSRYGLKYLSMVLPQLVGNVGIACGATTP